MIYFIAGLWIGFGIGAFIINSWYRERAVLPAIPNLRREVDLLKMELRGESILRSKAEQDAALARHERDGLGRGLHACQSVVKAVLEAEDSHIAFGASTASRVAHEQRRTAAYQAARSLLVYKS